MNENEPNRLNDTRLDADLSVLGDDHGGDPKVARVGSAPAPQSTQGLKQIDQPVVGHDEQRASDELEQHRAEKDARREVVDRYGKS